MLEGFTYNEQHFAEKNYHNTKQSFKELQNIAQSVWISSCIHFPWAAFVTGDKEHWLYLLKWENVGTKRGNSARVNLDHTSGLSLFVKQVGVGFGTRPFLYSRCWGWLIVSLSRLSSLSVDGSTRWSESNVEQFDTLIFTERKKTHRSCGRAFPSRRYRCAGFSNSRPRTLMISNDNNNNNERRSSCRRLVLGR